MSCFSAVKGQPKVSTGKGMVEEGITDLCSPGKETRKKSMAKAGPKAKAKADDGEVKVDTGGGPENGADEVHDGPAKKKRKKSIFDYSPQDYTSEIFKANNPFVAVVETSSYPKKFPNDKVADDQRMDKAALRTAMRAVVKSTAVSARAYKSPRTEIGGRIIHGSMAMDVWRITNPSSEPCMSSVEDLFSMIVSKPVQSLSNEVEAQEDLTIKIGEMKSLKGDSLVESVTMMHEEDEQTEDKTRSDLRFYVRDKRMHHDENLVLVLQVECKWDGLSRNVIFQAAAYVAKKYATKNMKKGRFDPIYLQGWAENVWCYGILYPTGVVEVRGGRVLSVTRYTVAEMQASLERATQDLRRISGDETVTYPNATYICGILYVPHEARFPLPNLKIQGGLISWGAKLFFQALFRIIVGDKVLKWSEDDVRQVVKLRKKMLKDDIEMAFQEF